jgi:hypothetical protein
LPVLLKNLCVPIAAEEKRGFKFPRNAGLLKFNSDCEMAGIIGRNED